MSPSAEVPEPAPSPPTLYDTLVVDLSRYLAGPMVARLLGDLGARVVKVEEPRLGDPCRQAPPVIGGRSALAALLLAGHESIALDLKKEGGREVLEALLERADVLVESFRPGTLARWGLAPETLRRRYPRLVVCSISGWGQEGPLAGRAGHDLGYQAVGGAMAATGEVPAIQVADMVGAWAATATVLAALLRREREGTGGWVDQALLDAAGHAGMTAWSAEAERAHTLGEPLTLSGALPCYNVYRTRDGQLLALAALERHFWRRFCVACERQDLLGKGHSRDRRDHRRVARLVASRTGAEWAELLRQHDLPGELVLSPATSLAHPQVEAQAMFRRAADGLLRLGYPARLDGRRPQGGDRCPELGEHTAAVLGELGLAGALAPRRGVGPRRGLRRWIGSLAGALRRRAGRRVRP